MRRALALAAVAAVVAVPFAGVSSADPAAGCVTTFAVQSHPSPRVVWIDGYGRVVVDPNGAMPTAASVAQDTGILVNCLV